MPKSRTFQSIDSFGVDGPSKTIYFFQMKSADVKTVKGDKVEEYWTTASELEIERCVLVYVVPAGERWERAKKKKVAKRGWASRGERCLPEDLSCMRYGAVVCV